MTWYHNGDACDCTLSDKWHASWNLKGPQELATELYFVDR